MNKYVLGKTGEELAVRFLKNKGYKIFERNFRCSVGEIDIVAEHKNTIVFIEVKLRRQERFELPQNSVTKFKQLQIIKVAIYYLKQKNFLDKPVRFDVVTIFLQNKKYKIELFQNAFLFENTY